MKTILILTLIESANTLQGKRNPFIDNPEMVERVRDY
jgi:hypothetical protein